MVNLNIDGNLSAKNIDKIEENINKNGYGTDGGGVNLLKPTGYNTTTYVGDVVCIQNNDGSITIKGKATSAWNKLVIGTCKLEPGVYTFSSKCYNSSGLIFFETPTEDAISSENFSFRITDTTDFYIRVSLNVGDYDFTIYPQIEKGLTATEYEPWYPSNKDGLKEDLYLSTELVDIKMLGYSIPRECPIQNEVNGNQFIQKVGRVDLSSLSYTYEPENVQFYSGILSSLPQEEKWNFNLYCNKYPTGSRFGDSYIASYGGRIYIRDKNYTNGSTLVAGLKNTYLYYELATPITTIIDGNEIDQRHSTNLTNQQNNGYLQKNLVDYKSLFSELSDNAEGTTHTYSDGVLKISRTANIYSGVYVFSDNIIPLKGKELVVSFDAKSSVSTIKLSVYISAGEVAGTTENLTTDYKRYRLNIKAGSTQDVLIIYGNDVAGDVWIKNFMITEKYVEDTTYVDRIKSNMELDTCKADKSETTVNLLNPTLETTIVNGVTCTNNGDGTYTLNGTATNVNATFDLSFSCSLNSSVKLLGCPKNIDGVMIQTMYNGSWEDPTTWDNTGNGVILSDASKINRLSLFVLKDKSVKNAIFKPMITTNLNATYDDFVPYTGSTGALNTDVASLLARIKALEAKIN